MSFNSDPRHPHAQSERGTAEEADAGASPRAGHGFLRAVLWGDVLASLALLFPALDYYQPLVRPYAAASILVSLAVEALVIRALRRGAKRFDGLVLLLAGLFGFYAVHNFVAVGMMLLRPTWYGAVFVLAGAFFAWAAVGLLRIWAKR